MGTGASLVTEGPRLADVLDEIDRQNTEQPPNPNEILYAAYEELRASRRVRKGRA